MAGKNPIINIEVNEEGDGYLVTRCDGTTYILPCVDCGNGGGGGTTTPPGLPQNGRSRCYKVGWMAKVIQDQFVDLIKTDQGAGQWMDQTPQVPSGATYEQGLWMIQWGIPVGYFGAVNAWMLSETNPVDWYNATDGGWTANNNYTCVANYIECCLPLDELLSDAFFDCLYANLLAGQLPCSAEAPQDQSALKLLAGYMQAFGNDYWREKFVIAVSGTTATNPVNCANFDDCDEDNTVGCLPDAVYAEYVVDWEGNSALPPGEGSIVWDGGTGGYSTVPSCYGGNAYDPCTPYNARLGLQFYMSGFDACLRGLRFSFAGNGKTNSTKARIYVNEVLQANLTGLIGRTRCVNAGGSTPYSAGWTAPAPIPHAVSVRIEFYDLTGSDPNFGVDMHCVKIDLAFP